MGWDEDKQDTRNFMLRRIVSKVTSVKGVKPFDPPAQELILKAVDDLDSLGAKQTAKIKVERDSEAWFKFELDLQGNGNSDEVTINYHDVYVLAEQLREYAGQIKVLKPDALIQVVRAGYERVANDHA
jgi:proteasome accessory factor B